MGKRGPMAGPTHFRGVTVQVLLPEVTCGTQAGAHDSLNIDDGALTVAVQIGGVTGCISQHLVCSQLHIEHVDFAIAVQIAADGARLRPRRGSARLHLRRQGTQRGWRSRANGRFVEAGEICADSHAKIRRRSL